MMEDCCEPNGEKESYVIVIEACMVFSICLSFLRIGRTFIVPAGYVKRHCAHAMPPAPRHKSNNAL